MAAFAAASGGRALFLNIRGAMAQRAMRREKLVWERPNVSTNAHTSDSHYEASAGRSATIHEGDLSDRYLGRWTGRGRFLRHHLDRSSGARATEREQLVFETVRNARDASVAVVEKAFAEDG